LLIDIMKNVEHKAGDATPPPEPVASMRRE
jgi:hypothetical protein